MPRNPDCRKCGLWESSKHVCVWGDGPSDAEIVAIGEAPGEAEARTGKPFMGRSGQLLRSELSKADLRNVYITNIVKCRPPDNRTPTPEEIKACRPYLDEELATIKPKYVLTLGSPATKTVLKKSKITEAHGQMVPVPHHPEIVGMGAYHPAYALRDPSKLPVLRGDLERLSRTIGGEVWDSDIDWKVVTKKTIQRFLLEFQEAEEFSFDLETSGLFPYDRQGFVRCVGLAFNDKGWVIPMEMPDSPYNGGRWEAQRRLMSIIFELAEKKSTVAHNGKFDNHWLEEYYGSKFHLDFDTMLAHHILDENQPHDLKYLSRLYLDVGEYDLTSKEKQGKIKNPLDLYEYNAKDCVYTLRLRQRFRKMLKQDEPTRRLFQKLVMPVARALEDIERVGLTIDMPKFAETEVKVKSELSQQEGELNRLAGHAVNWNSPKQVAKVLYEEKKIKCVVFTDKGAPSTGELAIVGLKGKHPLVDALIRYRELEKFRGTYIDGWKNYMIGDKLFLGYKIHGTVTGRFSSRLHQVPRDGTIRNLVTAPPGWDFFQADLKQAELCIAAELSGDLELRRCFLPGGADVHWRTLLFMILIGSSGEYVRPAMKTALEICREAGEDPPRNIAAAVEILSATGHDKCIEIWKPWKEARKKAKAINFGFIYGMYENKFIETAKTKYDWEPTWTEAHEAREGYFQLYRGIPDWHDSTKKLVRLDGFVRSLSGRLRRLPGISSSDKMIRMECERQAINSPVQGFIGDYKAMALIEIHESIDHRDLRLAGEHHDALLGMVRRGPNRESSLRKMVSIMRQPKLLQDLNIKLSVPMGAEIEIGPWGAGKPWRE